MVNWFFGMLVFVYAMDVVSRLYHLLTSGRPPVRSVGEYAGDAVLNALMGLWAYFVWNSL